jgi:hypothetical protein
MEYYKKKRKIGIWFKKIKKIKIFNQKIILNILYHTTNTILLKKKLMLNVIIEFVDGGNLRNLINKN